mgnify:CR=1 FL=1
MSIEAAGAYSPDIIYGQLTMPFANKPTSVNAHTSYDKTEEDENTTGVMPTKAISSGDLYNNKSRMLASVQEIRNTRGIDLNKNLLSKIEMPEWVEFPPESPVDLFRLSSFNKKSNIIYDAVQNGYSTDEAVAISKAHVAYATAARMPQNPVRALLNTDYIVE